jgi:nitroreductase
MTTDAQGGDPDSEPRSPASEPRSSASEPRSPASEPRSPASEPRSPAITPPRDPGAPLDLAALEAAWCERRSVRGFRPEPIPRDTLVRLFSAAQRAPSWCNVQPWRVALTEPPLTGELAAAMQAAARSSFPRAELPFPLDYPSPYKERRIACGAELYQAMGVAREDKAGRYDAYLRNYAFFDAPHVAIVACDRRLGPYAYIDVGVWLGYVLSAAAALGIDTCPMASVAAFPEPLRQRLPIAETDLILFGLALGRIDDTVAANRCRTDRDPIEANITFSPSNSQ